MSTFSLLSDFVSFLMDGPIPRPEIRSFNIPESGHIQYLTGLMSEEPNFPLVPILGVAADSV